MFLTGVSMNKTHMRGIGLLSCIICILLSLPTTMSGISFGHKETDTWFAFTGSFKPEFFYGSNISLLNDNNPADRILYARHTLDLKFDASYGREKYGHDIIYTRFSPRNKTIWGDPKGYFQTTDNTIKSLEVVFGPHRHYNPRLFFWIREVWIELDLNDVLNWYSLSRHTLTIGAFKFQLGRGIALGDAYAVGPDVLGFYTDSAVDQYAFGIKLSGDIIEDKLTYDLYGANLENKSSSVGDTAERILGQEYGCRRSPERGFGKINFLVAGRLNWTAINIPNFARVTLEPYWLYNAQPEQRIEFLGDARSTLGTLGIASEYQGSRFDFGLEYAVNLGSQYVKGWDRNTTDFANRNGYQTIINTQVIYQNKNNSKDPLNNKKFPYMPGSNAQELIEDSPQDESQNGKEIGTATFDNQQITLVNSDARFKDPYSNKFEGWMFVADAAWWNQCKDLNVAVTFGFASGDDNPNEVTKDGIYSGFIPLQSLYSGMSKRVKSAFILGGSGKLKRPLALPISRRPAGRFAPAINGFTNLIFTGGAVYWQPNLLEGRVVLHPNMIFYWQDMPVKGYDATTGLDTKDNASKFLGTEFCVFFDYFLKPPLRLYLVSSVFIPGTHFTDILGKPINRLQLQRIQDRIARLDRQDRTGYLDERIPNIGDDTAFTVNLGIEFRF